MKKITLKKSILTSIGLLSSILTLILMSSKFICMSVMPDVNVLAGIAYETGFTMLDFNSIIFAGYNWNFGTIITAISSYISLALAICGIIILSLGFFLFEHEKVQKASLNFCILNVIAAAIYMAAGVFCTIIINATIKKTLGAASSETLLYKTSAFLPLIFEVLSLVAFLICKKLIPEKKTNKASLEKTDNAVKQEVSQKSIAVKEDLIVKLITKYNEIYKESVITVMDFEKKKYGLMFENEKLNLDDEEIIINVLIQYHTLYNLQIINRDEFEKKKLQLMF